MGVPKPLLLVANALLGIFFVANVEMVSAQGSAASGNPIFPGWYADPEAVIFNKRLWIFPTFSAPYEKQVFLDAFSSEDLVNWQKHERILDTGTVKWAHKAMWAPSIVKKGKKYFLFFSANDIQSAARKNWDKKHPEAVDDTVGGIGIAVADKPEGPYRDYLGKPLVNKFYNGAQPIDQFVFKDDDKQYYLVYGGWRHCNIARLNNDFTGFLSFSDTTTFKSITPEGYVEGPLMFRRKGRLYFMWSEGGWTGPDYRVAYAIADSPLGPFKRIGTVLKQDPAVATGAGHHSVVNIPGTDDWYIVYHRRPLGDNNGNHREVCIDKMRFNDAGEIEPVTITKEGVASRKLK